MGDLEKPAQDLINQARELYRLVGRMEATARRMKTNRMVGLKLLKMLGPIDTLARKASMYVDEMLLGEGQEFSEAEGKSNRP